MDDTRATLDKVLGESAGDFTTAWLAEVESMAGSSLTASSPDDARKLHEALRAALGMGADPARFDDRAWDELRTRLATFSHARAAQGAPAGETSAFVMAVKRPLMVGLQRHLPGAALFDAIWTFSTLVDKMAQWTVATYQKSREEVIRRQQEELLELSTPVVKLWEGVLAVPMIGTLDSSRTQLVMESLLQRIVETGSELAIIDITGVPTVDTLVAQHLLKTVTAIRLMGADCIISGIRPQIAQTIVHLGIDLQGIVTKATLADALTIAIRKAGFTVTRDKR